MTYDPHKHHRRSIRLKGYDYTQAGAYFVTICTQNRECLFGEVVDGEMRLNAAGQMIQSVWNELPAFYPGVDIDEFVVMPNHIHGIIVLVGATPCGRPVTPPNDHPVGATPCGRPEPGQAQGRHRGLPLPTVTAMPTLSLPDVVHRFKTLTTKRYADGVKQLGWPPFPGRLWQRNYYEHIIRNEESLNRLRQYIANNPAQWQSDGESPRAVWLIAENP